jgi:hypothetical protein
MVGRTHTAVGPMAGYLFQTDRALLLLCKCKNNESVSIELVDDVAILDENGDVNYREQDKNSIREDGEPFKARSRDLWKTLEIWTDEIINGTLDIDKTILVCATNKILEESSLIKRMSLAKKKKEIDAILAALQIAAKTPPSSTKSSIAVVMKDLSILRKIISKIDFIEGNSFLERNEEIANELHLRDEIKENVIDELRGWLQGTVLAQLDMGAAPIIKKSDFNMRYSRSIQKETDNRIKILGKTFVKRTITKEKIAETVDSTFVKQLELIEHSEKHNIILDAIDDFLCSETERTRLTITGDLTRQELEDMDTQCKDRWTQMFRRKVSKMYPEMQEEDLAKLAFEIYDSTVNDYWAKIRGFETDAYFTRGSFHRQSDLREIGWHPQWEKYFKEE